MDRLVRADVEELKFSFARGHKCTATFKLTNLMHTMSVAVSLSTTNPSSFTFPAPFSLLPPLSTTSFILHLSHPSDHPPLSSPPDAVTVRSSMLPTGKASPDELRLLFSRPGSHIFKDATIPISLVGPHVAEFLFCTASKTQEVAFLLKKALSGCDRSELNSLLRYAATGGYSRFLCSLIDAGADPNHKDLDSDKPSILSLAVQSGDSDSVRALIESGYSVDPSDRLLHDAAAIDRVDLMEILCQGLEEINLDSTDFLGRTALHIAAIRGNIEAVGFLISVGSDPDIEDSTGWTPLHYCASKGCLESVESLVNSSSCAKHCLTRDGDTAFSLAVENGHFQLFDLLRLGDDLHRAARTGDVEEIRRCLAEGAKVNSRDQNGWTPLHRAAFKGRIECVKVLLSNGAEADVLDNSGRTALHLASDAGHLQVVSCLASHGTKASEKIVKKRGFEKGRFNLDCFKNHPSFVSHLCQEKERA